MQEKRASPTNQIKSSPPCQSQHQPKRRKKSKTFAQTNSNSKATGTLSSGLIPKNCILHCVDSGEWLSELKPFSNSIETKTPPPAIRWTTPERCALPSRKTTYRGSKWQPVGGSHPHVSSQSQPIHQMATVAAAAVRSVSGSVANGNADDSNRRNLI